MLCPEVRNVGGDPPDIKIKMPLRAFSATPFYALCKYVYASARCFALIKHVDKSELRRSISSRKKKSKTRGV